MQPGREGDRFALSKTGQSRDRRRGRVPRWAREAGTPAYATQRRGQACAAVRSTDLAGIEKQSTWR